MFELVRLYIKYVRPTPVLESAKRFQFNNDNGHQLLNQSNELGLGFWALSTFIYCVRID